MDSNATLRRNFSKTVKKKKKSPLTQLKEQSYFSEPGER